MPRTEKDALGSRQVPDRVFWGIHTLRAKENFPISGKILPKGIFYAIAEIKIATAQANQELEYLTKKKSDAIVRACKEILKGDFDKEFVVDAFQAGAGTATHMNVNEVIANRATIILGGKKGQYLVHPNDDVNMGQSTNNVFPTSIKIVSLRKLKRLVETLDALRKELIRKSREFDSVLKTGRTHIQDAVPITLGQEFKAYATAVEKNIKRIKHSIDDLHELNIGKNAIGTGINTNPKFTKTIIKHLKKIERNAWRESPNHIYSTQNVTVFLETSHALDILAVDLTKMLNDLRLLSSGPNAGLNEINLPAVEPGSSIMPGKVNPSMAEMLNMVCFQVMGNDYTIKQCVQNGQLELNVFTPTIAKNLIESIDILINGVAEFNLRCLKGITVNKEVCRNYFENSAGLGTLLNPYIGYDKIAEVVKESLKTKKNVREIVIEKGLLKKEEVDRIFDVKNVTKANLK